MRCACWGWIAGALLPAALLFTEHLFVTPNQQNLHNYQHQQNADDAAAASTPPPGARPTSVARAVSAIHRRGTAVARRLHSAQRAALAAGRTRSILDRQTGLSPSGLGAPQRSSVDSLGGRRKGAELASPWHRKGGAGGGPGGAPDEYRISMVADGTGTGMVKHERALAEWPATGDLRFERVSLRYFPGGPLALRGVNFHIKDCEKVGRVGGGGCLCEMRLQMSPPQCAP